MGPQEILNRVRERLRDYAGDDPDRWFYANRFVFARLQLDERKTKSGIKKDLLEDNKPCHYCGKPFKNKVGVHLHRLDNARGYSRDNCVLMHPDCHSRYHKENSTVGKRERHGSKCGPHHAMPTVKKVSKRYDGHSFIYWWDISPGFIEEIGDYEAVEFARKDTGEKCHVPTATLKSYLTEERRTSRGKGNWGIKVLKGREGELAFEPGSKKGKWFFLPVVWLNDTQED